MMNSDDLDIFAIFREQASGYLKNITAKLLELEKNPEDKGILQLLFRYCHSLKGAARAVQFNSIKELAHALEDIFSEAQAGNLSFSSAIIDEMLSANDLMEKLLVESSLEQIQEKSLEVGQTIRQLESLRDHPEQFINTTTPAQKESAPLAPPETPPETPPSRPETPHREAAVPHMFTMEAKVLDQMLEYSAELKIIGQLAGELTRRFRDYQEKAMHLGSQLSNLGFRYDREIVSSALLAEIKTIRGAHKDLEDALTTGSRDIEHLANQLTNTSSNLDSEIVQARLKTLEEMFVQIPRAIRDLANEYKKQVEVTVTGEHVKIDRAILGVIKMPLLHLLRNAVGHGIESPQQRERTGKSPIGQIIVRARQVEDHIIIEVEDDGRGIDIEKIRRQVISRGDLAEKTAVQLARGELLDFLFLPGFTTSKQLTDLSGRGVGLDIVKSEVEAMGGSVSISTQTGKHTIFSMRFPLNISLTPALLISGGSSPLFGQQIYAIPVHQIASIESVDAEAIFYIEDRQMVEINNQLIPLSSLSTLFSLNSIRRESQQKRLVILSLAGRWGALMVDEILHWENIIVRSLDPRVGKVQDVSGTAVLKDGKGILVLDVHDLLNTIYEMRQANSTPVRGKIAKETQALSILVVEDSLTVRELVRRVLVAQKYHVVTAVDGRDGLHKFEQQPIDLLISDIDMPRMNGFEMIQAIRNTNKNPHVPVIVLSYKERDKDREQAFALGAREYLTKADFDQGALLDAIARVIGK